jgi:diguanylate cyclase (GGDEF)-like protein
MSASNSPSSQDGSSAKSLTQALGKSEHVKDVVEECAEELSTVNSTLKEGLGDLNPPPTVESALEKSETIEDKVQSCAEELAAVNQALEEEVQERERLEHQLISVRKQEEAAREAAFHDPLTFLPNRVLFNDRLEHGLAQAERHQWTLAVMFIDLDDFKSVNDAYGHVAGDKVLQTVADRLKNITRKDDTVSRHGGDEFLYLLLEVKTEQDVALIAQKIIRTVGEPCEVDINNVVIRPTITSSIGISMFPRDGTTADALIKSADKAMYRAKRNRSGYTFAR